MNDMAKIALGVLSLGIVTYLMVVLVEGGDGYYLPVQPQQEYTQVAKTVELMLLEETAVRDVCGTGTEALGCLKETETRYIVVCPNNPRWLKSECVYHEVAHIVYGPLHTSEQPFITTGDTY